MTIANGLSVSDVVNVSVSLAPNGASERNFGALLIVGDSSVIDTNERYRQYSSLAGVAGDFSGSAPEYLAAALFFSQSPNPSTLYVGRWASAATSALLRGGALSVAQQALANFTGVTSGGMKVTINGALQTLGSINLSGASSLNGVASLITAALTGATCTWDATNFCFRITTTSTGTGATITAATAPVSGTDLSALLLLNAATYQYAVNGISLETIESAITTFCSISNNWYMLQIAATASIVDADYVSVAGIIQGQSVSRVFGVTTQEAGALSASSTTDLAYLMQAATYSRTTVTYSSQSPYASAGKFGIAATVNFNAAGTAITMKFKQILGLTGESLTETQAAALSAKNCDVFVNYNNGQAILQQGTMANGYFYDEIQNSDWLQNAIQTAVFNLLLDSPKVPQTDAGVNRIVSVITGQLQQGVTNGFIAPGVWNGPDIGNLETGDTLSTGFYVYAPPISSQSESVRTTRVAPTIQCAIKQAGAVHFAGVTVSVNA